MDKQILIDTEGLNGYKLEIPTDRMMTESRLIEHFEKMKTIEQYNQGGLDKKVITIDSMSVLNEFIDEVQDGVYVGETKEFKSAMDNLKYTSEYIINYDYMDIDQIKLIEQRIADSNANYQNMMKRDYDCPQNKWELTLPSKETREKNRKKRKYKK